MKVLDFTQGSQEWIAARVGKLGASRIADVVARTKSGYSASRANYAAELVIERLTRQPTEKFVNDAMKWGIERESEARDCYTFMFDASVHQVGIVLHPTIANAQASPDGLVGDDGLLEIKCPQSAQHIETLLTETVPDRYLKQVNWQMACTGRSYCDFVSFDPRVPAEMQLFVKRVHRDDALIAELESEAIKFLAEIDDKLSKLQAKFGVKEAA